MILGFIKKNKGLTLVVLVYSLLLIFMPEKAMQSEKNSRYYIIEMIEIMPVVFVLTTLIEAWIPKKVIIKHLGEQSGIKGGLISLALGSFSAGPIYAAFPLCKMLMNKGAGLFNIVVILSAWAVVKVPMLANEAKFLGFQFMGIRWILSVISIFLMAWIVRKVMKNKNIQNTANKKIMDNNLQIEEQFCIGCGLCKKLCPQYFGMENGKATIKNTQIDKKELGELKEVVDKCPANAIILNLLNS